MVVKIKGAQAKATVAKVHPNGAETEETELVGDPKLFQQPPCNVGVKVGATINTGNYSSMRFDVTLNVPCTHDEIDSVFEFAKTWCDSKAEVIINEIEEAG